MKRQERTAVAVLATVFLFNLLGRGSGDTYAVFLLPLEREFGWRGAYQVLAAAVFLAVPIALFVVPWRLYVAGLQESVSSLRERAAAAGWTVKELRNFR